MPAFTAIIDAWTLDDYSELSRVDSRGQIGPKYNFDLFLRYLNSLGTQNRPQRLPLLGLDVKIAMPGTHEIPQSPPIYHNVKQS